MAKIERVGIRIHCVLDGLTEMSEQETQKEVQMLREVVSAGRVPGGFRFRIYTSDQPESERRDWIEGPSPPSDAK